MQLQEICHKDIATILARNSETLPNYLANNIYCEDKHRCILNSCFVAWIHEEIFDLGFLNKMLPNPKMSRLVRSEIRYSVNNSKQYQQNSQTINELIDFKVKYREFKIGAVFHNQTITQFDIIDCNLVCLSSEGKVTLIDLQQNQTKEVVVQNDKKCNTNDNLSKYIRLLLSRNQPSLCYALNDQLQLSCISFKDGSILFNLNLSNAGFLIRSLELKERLVLLPDNDLLVISAKKTISRLDKISGKITSCVYSDEFVDNFVISQIETDLFLIHSNLPLLLFLKKHNLPEDSKIFNFVQQDQQQPSNSNQSNKLATYIQQFSSQTALYKRIKESFSFNLWKIQQDSSDNFCFYFRSYILSKLLDFLSTNDIPLKEWIRLALIVSVKRKPKELQLFITLINALVIEQKIKNSINNYLWEFLPLFDYQRGELEDSYKQAYFQAAKSLNRTQEFNNYMN